MKTRRAHSADNDCQPVTPVRVPRNDKGLVTVSPERVRRLREHLIKELHDLRKANHPDRLASPVSPEPVGFAGRVARIACTLCKGRCCRNGDDDAYLDDRTLARVRLAKPELTEPAVLRLYLKHVPPVAYRHSCIFHGRHGCALDRSLRADICNSYFCGGLSGYIRSGDPATPTVVIAGEGDKMRTSPVLMP